MLNALGRADVLPGVAKLERADDLSTQYDAAVEAKTADLVLSNAMQMRVDPFSSSAQYALNNAVASRQEAAAAAQRVYLVSLRPISAKTGWSEELRRGGTLLPHRGSARPLQGKP